MSDTPEQYRFKSRRTAGTDSTLYRLLVIGILTAIPIGATSDDPGGFFITVGCCLACLAVGYWLRGRRIADEHRPDAT